MLSNMGFSCSSFTVSACWFEFTFSFWFSSTEVMKNPSLLGASLNMVCCLAVLTVFTIRLNHF
jgi:hypothetical protein